MLRVTRHAGIRRTPAKDGPHPAHVLGRLIERDRHRQRRPDPEIALLELGHELPAEQGEEEGGRCDRYERERRDELRVSHDPLEHRVVHPAERPHRPTRGLPRVLGNELRRENRRQRQRQKDRTADGERIGTRHGPEDHARHTRHREERQERDADDQRRERHRCSDLARPPENTLALRSRSVRPQVMKNTLHHDDRRVDDDPEVDRAE